jgi:glutamyl-tRNA reductase
VAELLCVGLSHKGAPIEIREQLAVSEEALPELLARATSIAGVSEALLLSTCNRVELVAVVQSADAGGPLVNVLSGNAPAAVRAHLRVHTGEAAMVHLFRVAASLDSMVVGEPQILGQVKDAFAQSVAAGTVGGELTRACEAAFASAKRVRTETGIGAAAVSMASAAVELAHKIFGAVKGRTVLVVGAGPMSELCARHLSSEAAKVLVANRTHARAEALCLAVGGGAQPRPFESLPQLLVEADIVVSSTAAPRPIFTRELVQAALKARRGRPLFLVDLAVPRDVAPEVHGLDGVYAFNVDDLEQVVAQNLQTRSGEAARAEVLVAEEVARFSRSKAARDAVPILGQLRRRADQIALAEAEKTLATIGAALSARQRQSVEAMARAIVNKLLHTPTARLREAGESGPEQAARLAAAAAELFDLEAPAADEAVPAVIPLHRAEGTK